MSNNQEHKTPVRGRTRDEAHLDTLRRKMPEMDKLFTALDAGVTPNFLDIIAAIGEMVAFYTDHDQISEDLEDLQKKMSQKNCRFCS